MVGPAAVAHALQGRGQALRGDGVGVQVGPPLRQRGVRAQRVASPVARPEVPVQVPHVLAPAQHLADEALDGGERHVARRGTPTRPRARRRAGAAGPRFSGTDSSECAIAQSSVSIASSGGPKAASRCCTKWRSAGRPPSAVTANQRGPSTPTRWRARARRGPRGPARRSRPPPAATARRRRGAATPFGGGSRFSSSKFHGRSTGSSPSMRTSKRLPLGAVEVLHAERRRGRRPTRRTRAGQRERRRRQHLLDEPSVCSRSTRSAAAHDVGSCTTTGRPTCSSASR